MKRYVLEAYISEILIFYMEFKSITSVAKAIDKFCNCDSLDILFDVYDILKDKTIDVDELMRIWHS